MSTLVTIKDYAEKEAEFQIKNIIDDVDNLEESVDLFQRIIEEQIEVTS